MDWSDPSSTIEHSAASVSYATGREAALTGVDRRTPVFGAVLCSRPTACMAADNPPFQPAIQRQLMAARDGGRWDSRSELPQVFGQRENQGPVGRCATQGTSQG